MRWFLRNGTSNLNDRVTILRCHIDFTHAHMCRIDNNILIWATTHYFCDTEEKDTASRINGLPFLPQHRTINYSCLVKPTKHKANPATDEVRV